MQPTVIPTVAFSSSFSLADMVERAWKLNCEWGGVIGGGGSLAGWIKQSYNAHLRRRPSPPRANSKF